MKFPKFLATLVLAPVLAACAHPINAGTVTGRDFTPAHTSIVPVAHYVTVCSGIGSSRRCSNEFTGYTYIPVFHPDDWELHIRNPKQDGWVGVSQRDYLAHPVGSHWTRAQAG